MKVPHGDNTSPTSHIPPWPIYAKDASEGGTCRAPSAGRGGGLPTIGGGAYFAFGTHSLASSHFIVRAVVHAAGLAKMMIAIVMLLFSPGSGTKIIRTRSDVSRSPFRYGRRRSRSTARGDGDISQNNAACLSGISMI